MSILDRINNNQESLGDKRDPRQEAVAGQVQKILENLEQHGKSLNEESLAPTFHSKDERRKFLKKVLDIHRELINNSDFDVNEFNVISESLDEQKKIRAALEKQVLLIMEAQNFVITRREKAEIIEAIVNETIGLGPIEELIKDDTINEIMINGCNRVYVERGGIIQETPIIFYDDEHLKRIILRIVGKIGRRIDEGMPMVDARLKDGSRINAIIPPVSLTGPILTIRKFSNQAFTSKDLIHFGSMNPSIEEFLRICVLARMNIVVSGGTGSGKTTLLNVLSSFIPAEERIITIEDSAELRLSQDHVITLETRPPNIEGTGEITIRDLVRNSLRMRPDRLIVGEVRGGEALDMLQAMNTGHDGSMTTAHANTPRDLISRLETMVLMAGVDLPVKAIRQQIASAFQIIIQQSRLQDGTRKIVRISEICGMEQEIITLKDIFVFEQTGFNEKLRKVEGEFKATGLIPNFVQKIESHGLKFPKGLFNPETE